jgi:glycine/D-amino acid oxidase-like deaminating enzyme/nitrite reductase/ring-hydroxylating ferredoxin subunit
MCPNAELFDVFRQTAPSTFLAPGAVMDKDTRSLWIGTTETPRFATLSGDLHVDVAIVGAGITGLTAAILLKERGRKVAVLEKDGIVEGETGYTTAHITEAVDVRYHFLKRHFDQDAARTMRDASRAAIEQIAQLIERYGIECRFRRLPGYLYTEKRSYVAGLKSEAVSAAEAGAPAKWITEVPLPFLTRGAVYWEDQAQFHPREYLLGLARQLQTEIYERTLVTSITEGEPCVIETPHGRVTADAVFMATNVPIASYQTIHTKAAAYRTYALAYEVSGAHPDGLFWDTADPYHYTRWQDTDEGTYIIIGGEDHKVGQEEDTEGSFARLEEYAQEKFGVSNPRYRWSGQVIEPHDGVPFIGGNGKLFLSTAYAGQGMTFGTAGAMLVTDLITGVDNPWAKLFDPSRVHLRGAVTDLVTENLDFPKHLIEDRVLSRDVEGNDPFDVKAGEAKILSVDGRKVAAYRDEAGTLHTVSPVCTHMRCDVAWNDVERSWDCPCHGSRFTPEGEVMNGPAKVPLEKIDLAGR